MTKLATDQLINRLSEDLQPARRMTHPAMRLAGWAGAGILYAVIVVNFLGVRPDLPSRLESTAFIFENALAAFIFLSAATASFFLCIPDMRGQKWLLSLTGGLTGAFALWIAARCLTEDVNMPALAWDHCFVDAFLMVFIPTAALIFMMRRGATTRPVLQAAMNTLAVAALAYIGLRVTCTIETIGHGVFLHMLPFLVLGPVYGLAARRIYKW